MNSPIIETRGLSKTYRLYKKPHYRFLDMFGMLRGTGRYTELSALDNVDLRIERGEKVAIIGRNGAGKSTFLKLVSGVIEPSSGELDVSSNVHALLQIGTGFHPEFTGRENVYSYLAQLGITGKEADDKLQGIIEFAELEEYIEQPIKTYSTGMGVRLMFSTSTAITPEVLVLDEVLGVGDAYFTQKSYERIRDLCDEAGTTLLLVTHDLYAAMRICTRFIWIDRGRVILDSDAETVVNRYEASIRDQEEHRLRKLSMKAIRENLQRSSRGGDRGQQVEIFFGQLRGQGTLPLEEDVPIRRITLWKGDDQLATIAPGEADEGEGMTLSLKKRTGNWGPVTDVDGIATRCFATSGSIYHRAPFIIHADAFDAAQGEGDLAVELEFKDTVATPLIVDVFNADGARCLRADFDNTGGGEWVKRRIALQATSRIEAAKPKFNRYGSQLLSITNVVFLDSEDNERLTFDVGEKVTIRLHYKINDPSFSEKAIVHVSFLQNGVARSHRFTLDDELFDFNEADHGVLEITADPLLLGPGEYLVNVAAMREGGYARDAEVKFFTANENMLDHHSRAYRLMIRPTENGLVNDVTFLHPVTWRRNGRVVFEGTYTLSSGRGGEGAGQDAAGAGVRESVERLRRSILELVRAMAVGGDEDLDFGADADADVTHSEEIDHDAAFEDLARLVDAGGSVWNYHDLDDAPGVDATAKQHGFMVNSSGAAAAGSIGVAGVWGMLEEVPDAAEHLARIARSLAVGGLVVVNAPALDAPAFDGRTLRALFTAAGLSVIDVVGEGAIDYPALANSLRASTPTSRDAMTPILRELAQPLSLMARLTGFAPRVRVIACRDTEASRFASAVARLQARRAQDVYEATLSTGLEPDADSVAIYLDPPSIDESDRLFQATTDPIDVANVVLADDMMRVEDGRIVVNGVAETPNAYVMCTAPREFADDACLVAEGFVRTGGLTVGLLQNDLWVSQVSVTTPGGFKVAIQVPASGSFAVVLANCLPEDGLENDFDLKKLGIVHHRRSKAPVRG